MDELECIKARVMLLTPEREAELHAWLTERDHSAWDEQIARDFDAGKLDGLIAEAKADRDARHGRDL